LPTEPTPHRSEDELLALVRGKAAAIRYRRRVAAVGAGALSLLLIAGGVALAGNGSGDGKRTVHVAGEVPSTTAEATTTTEGPTTVPPTTAVPVTSTSTTSTTVPAATVWQTVDGGTVIDVKVTPGRPLAGQSATFTVRARNDHGPLTWGGVDWGDGTTYPEGSFYCDMIAQNPDGSTTVMGGVPADAPASDETHTYHHAYRRAGTFKVTINFETNQCDSRRSIASHGDVVVR